MFEVEGSLWFLQERIPHHKEAEQVKTNTFNLMEVILTKFYLKKIL